MPPLRRPPLGAAELLLLLVLLLLMPQFAAQQAQQQGWFGVFGSAFFGGGSSGGSGGGVLAMRPPSAKLEAAMEADGKHMYERIQQKIAESSCVQSAYLRLETDCDTLLAQPQKKKALAYALARCHMADTQFPIEGECGDDAIASCIKRLDQTQVNIYTNFHNHADALCFFLQSETWHEHVQLVNAAMLEASEVVADRLIDMNETVDELGRGLVERIGEAKETLAGAAELLETDLAATRDAVVRRVDEVDEGVRGMNGQVLEHMDGMSRSFSDVAESMEGISGRIDDAFRDVYGKIEAALVDNVATMGHMLSARVSEAQDRIDRTQSAIAGVADSLDAARREADEDRRVAAEERRGHAEERAAVLEHVSELRGLMHATTSGWTRLQTAGFLVLACVFSWIFTSVAPFSEVRPHLFALFFCVAAAEYALASFLRHGADACGAGAAPGLGGHVCQAYGVLRGAGVGSMELRLYGTYAAVLFIILALLRWVAGAVRSFFGFSSAGAVGAASAAGGAATLSAMDLQRLVAQSFALGAQQGRLSVELKIAMEELRSGGWSPGCSVPDCTCELHDDAPPRPVREVSDPSYEAEADEEDDFEDEDEDEEEDVIVELPKKRRGGKQGKLDDTADYYVSDAEQ
mmetsp:Transcript_1467/g.3904  ORF Transcript_1467/g.3904 Transcript_1467/m.3904 type:complete len:634 (-) Transcript_1467:197-2098(-)